MTGYLKVAERRRSIDKKVLKGQKASNLSQWRSVLFKGNGKCF